MKKLSEIGYITLFVIILSMFMYFMWRQKMAALRNLDRLLLDRKRLNEQLDDVNKQIEDYGKQHYLIDIPTEEYKSLKKMERIVVKFVQDVMGDI